MKRFGGQLSDRERAWLMAVKVSLHRGHLQFSEWAVKAPSGMRLRVGWDNRFERHQPIGHRTEM